LSFRVRDVFGFARPSISASKVASASSMACLFPSSLLIINAPSRVATITLAIRDGWTSFRSSRARIPSSTMRESDAFQVWMASFARRRGCGWVSSASMALFIGGHPPFTGDGTLTNRWTCWSSFATAPDATVSSPFLAATTSASE
jgi:hypothetical protein